LKTELKRQKGQFASRFKKIEMENKSLRKKLLEAQEIGKQQSKRIKELEGEVAECQGYCE
ncbi:MAG TPA: hypothetical protein VK145_02455, partial [Candidatus Nanoarchaeia archaeon]|nr:hypothetical protein [Candidatus Nanoarchaeia archaeon]